MIAPHELENRFTNLTPEDGHYEYILIRDKAKGFAEYLNEVVPDNRELALAITKLEEAVFWANAGIARRS